MTSYDDARENVVWGAADAFLSNNLDDLLDEIFERVDEEWEDGEECDPSDMVEEVVSDWISRISISDEIREYIYEQIDNETIYTADCMEIIADYGFSESLNTALNMGCDLSDVSESAVASAVLTLNMPDDDTMQDEIIRQIQECSSYLERVSAYENRELEEDEDEEEESDTEDTVEEESETEDAVEDDGVEEAGGDA